ncbi:MAG TPA: hypothetical protein VGG35_24600 [Streptosporangiaceae bacterium]|jgi:hypothetical protein
MTSAGERFARALAAKDEAVLGGLLAGQIDFQALTPGRYWQADTARQVVQEIILGRWFGPEDRIAELCSVAAGQVAQREHVAYRLRVARPDADYLVEQQAYYSTDGGQITWMRVLCSGYQPLPRPAGGEPPAG